MKLINGSKLSDDLKRTVLEKFVHRFTRDHKPEWANGLRESGKPWRVRFESDQDWLENTEFCIADDGHLSSVVVFGFKTEVTWDGRRFGRSDLYRLPHTWIE